jgi:hypothetical protein
MRKVTIIVIFDVIIGALALASAFLTFSTMLQFYKIYGWKQEFSIPSYQNAASFAPVSLIALLMGILFFVNGYIISKRDIKNAN